MQAHNIGPHHLLVQWVRRKAQPANVDKKQVRIVEYWYRGSLRVETQGNGRIAVQS